MEKKNVTKSKKADESSYEVFVRDFWTQMRKHRKGFLDKDEEAYVMVQENFSLYLHFIYLLLTNIFMKLMRV